MGILTKALRKEANFSRSSALWKNEGRNFMFSKVPFPAGKEGILDTEDTDRLIIKNTLGLAFPLLYGLEASAEMTYNYDGTASQDREEVDQVYKFRVGYAW